ncbi:MAG: peptidoglycan D,D-transpeptidase FtsI family protein [Acidimicrobiia bacterium]
MPGAPEGRPSRRALRWRIGLVGLAVVSAWAIMGVRLFQVQIVRADDLAARALDQRLTSRAIAADRGTIYDRRRNQLAITAEGATIFADPAQVTEPVLAAELLSDVLGLDRAELFEKLTSDSRFVFIARQLPFDQAGQVSDLQLNGLGYYREPRRVYPFGQVGAQVLGFTDIDNLGIEGIEFRYEGLLSGTPGELIVEVDPAGRIIPQGQSEIRPAVAGSDLILTLEVSIQYISEQACDRALRQTKADSCVIVVQEVETGAILSMANRPGFDPAERSAADPQLFANRAVRSTYEPGSTQKLVTIAAALEEGVVSWNTTLEVPDEVEVVEGACSDRTGQIQGCYEDFTQHPTKPMTVLDIVTESSNVGTILVQQRLGDDDHLRYLEAFGFGARTGIDFPGEASGAGAEGLDPTCSSCTAAAAIGYNVSVTPLQMASVYSTVANDGVWVRPHLVEAVVDAHGTLHRIEIPDRKVISPGTSAILRRLLQSVIEAETGTGQQATVRGYSVGGKTGTTNKYVPELGRYGDDVVASFVGMAPIDDPQLVVVVVLDSPQVGRLGGEVAAPVFSEVMERALHQMGVPPDA